MSDLLKYSVFYLGGPFDGKCLMHCFRQPSVGDTFSPITSIEDLPRGRGRKTGESGPLVVRAEYEVTHVNGLVAVARFVETRECTQRVLGWDRLTQGPQD